LQKQIAKFQSIYPPNHTAANPNGYVKIPDVVENIEKANLQKSDHRYNIRADILKMSEHKKKNVI
jgi:flagellar basal body rod protein FlgC